MTQYRTDRNNNPAAFTTTIAEQGGLKLGKDYEQGDPFFSGGKQYFTAKLIGDPIDLTIRVIDNIGYYTRMGMPRWTYIQIPPFVWQMLNYSQKKEVIAFHYKNEGGISLLHLFEDTPNISIGISDQLKIDGQ